MPRERGISRPRLFVARGLGAGAWALTRLTRRLDGRTPAPGGKTLEGDREVEWAWMLAHLRGEPGRVVELGAGNGLLSLAAAFRGHDVVAIDLLPCSFRFEEPRIDYRSGDFNSVDLEPGSFDQALCCSTIEHVGVGGRYGAAARSDADLEAMERLRAAVAPDGTIVLTLPVGPDAVYPPYHRVYGRDRLDRLLRGSEIVREEFRVKRGGRWTACGREVALAEPASASYYALGLFVLARSASSPGGSGAPEASR